MNVVINLLLEEGTFQIVCAKCRTIFYGPAYGDLTEAALKAMELFGDGNVCPKCGGELVIEIHPKKVPNTYDAARPYPQR